jgi:tripeptidyl-peptidase-1
MHDTPSPFALSWRQGMFGCKKFDPNWPASCPYVTAVGGTYMPSAGAAEQGWAGSGGGFSAVFPRPAYQTGGPDSVGHYLMNATLPPASLFTATGRATPDVSALCTNFRTFTQAWGVLTGTSAATPAFAGMVSVINDQRLAKGQPPVGFINPVLYQHAAGSLGADPVEGNNKDAGCKAGFPAQAGWDAVTGLGTPTLPKLTAVLSA